MRLQIKKPSLTGWLYSWLPLSVTSTLRRFTKFPQRQRGTVTKGSVPHSPPDSQPEICFIGERRPKISRADYERLRLTEITVDDIDIYDRLVAHATKDEQFLKTIVFELVRVAPYEFLTPFIDEYVKLKNKTGPKGPRRTEAEWIDFVEKAKRVEQLKKNGIKFYDDAIREACLLYSHPHYRELRREAVKLGYVTWQELGLEPDD